MKITTNLQWMEADFIEASKFFQNAEDLDVTHTHSEVETTVYDTVCIGDKTYEYSKDIGKTNDLEKKRYVKRYSKLALYKSLSDFLGQNLIWGALTGIRPVKYAYSIGDNWREEMAEEMMVDESKLDIIGKIIDEQKPIYELKENN